MCEMCYFFFSSTVRAAFLVRARRGDVDIAQIRVCVLLVRVFCYTVV